jgi:hypothetical protein
MTHQDGSRNPMLPSDLVTDEGLSRQGFTSAHMLNADASGPNVAAMTGHNVSENQCLLIL